MTVSRREACHIATTALVLGTVPTVTDAASPDLELVEIELPRTIKQGETVGVAASLENVGTEEIPIQIEYRFDDAVVAFKDITLQPGEQRTVSFPELESSQLTPDSPGPPAPGTYVHSIGAADGPRKAAEVEIVASEDTPSQEPTVETASEALEVVSRHLPETLARGESKFVGATVENPQSATVLADLGYTFAGEQVFTREGVEIEANSAPEVGFPDVTLAAIEESLGRTLEPGVYEHSFSLSDVIRLTGEIEITTAGERENATSASQDSTGSQDAIETTVPEGSEGVDGSESQSEAGRERGFFSNSGDSPDVLSNPVNLTTLGFVLSVAGIAHQLLQGS